MQEQVYMLEELRIIVHGIVQGVGFRAAAKQFADKLQLRGYVCNLPDGKVELCAQGPKEKLEELVKQLKRVFGKEYIHNLEITYRKATSTYPDFQIKRSF